MPRRKANRQEAAEPASSPDLTSEFEEAVVHGEVDPRDEPHDAEPTDVESIIKGEDQDDAGERQSVEFVKYVGRATERSIDAGSWPPGVDQGISAVWSFSNNFKIPASSFSKSQLDYLLGGDDTGFKLVDGARS